MESKSSKISHLKLR